jgi:hypothetical protein
MTQSTKRILLSLMAVIFLLAACAPAQSTQEPVDISDQVATAVALTVAAQNTQTAEAIPPATNTPLPTQTEAVAPSPTTVLSTATPLVLPTVTSGGGGGSGTTTKPEYACAVVRRTPADNTVFLPNKTFDISWTILNTGSKTMRAGLDLKFNSGDQLTPVTRVELPELKPGAQYTVDFDGEAPKKEGFHVMTFVVEGGLCYPYVVIKVEK